MRMLQSAGILLFRKKSDLEYLLVHPGGPYFKNKHEGWWTIPKGEINNDEQPLNAAIREFTEETGYIPQGPFTELDAIVQKGGKKVFCWACEGDFNASSFICNTFTLEWPPKSGLQQEFPEVDKAGWFSFNEAKILINKKQISSFRFWLLVMATVTYVVGLFGVTIAGNVPLNEMLDKFNITDSSAEEIAAMRTMFENKWNLYHMIRTISVVLSLIFILCSSMLTGNEAT